MWRGSQQPGSGGRTDGWSAGTALPPRCQHARPTSGNFSLSGPCQGIFKNLMTWARLWKPKFLIFYSIFSGKVFLLWKGVSSLICCQFCLFSDLPSVLSLLWSTVSFVCFLIYRQFCLFSYLPSVLSVLLFAVSFVCSLICRQFVSSLIYRQFCYRQFRLFSY